MSHNFGKPCPAEDLHFHMVCGHRDMKDVVEVHKGWMHGGKV